MGDESGMTMTDCTRWSVIRGTCCVLDMLGAMPRWIGYMLDREGDQDDGQGLVMELTPL